MKRLLQIALVVFSTFAYGQSTYWLQAAGSPNVDENLGIDQDNAGNLITVGYFVNTITFPNNSTLTSSSAGVSDALIQKTDGAGQVVWKVKAGGLGSDRATAVACDASGNIYVTGYYYGSAQFGGFTLNSVNNTKDVFIAKLNSSGTFVWAQSAGGNLAEEPYAINVDNQGNVIVTGEFQGTATFGTQTLTSMLNNSGNSSFDVFTVKYDNAGNFQWVRQGSARLDDRGMDVGTDASGNVFVCGQFSDTITFNQVHNNQINNAVFIIKYSPSGQELWFVRAGGTSSVAYGLAVDNSNDVYVTGDYTGNMIFYGNPNNLLFGNYANRIFLVKYSNSGSYLWGKEDASSSYVSSRDVALNASQDPCLYGEFDCRMDDYSVAAGGTGTFNSIGYHDLFVAQYDKNGSRQWMRNWGGPKSDRAHGIAFSTSNAPYVAGSFEYKMFVNSTLPGFNALTLNQTWADAWISSQNCNNSQGYYKGTGSFGASDCFILHGLDNSCPYYDYYYRPGGCNLNFVGGCIDNYTYNCPDTVKACGGSLTANPYTGNIGGIGPFYHYHWNTGDTGATHTVTASGNYSCIMTTEDGCFSSEDTVYAVLYPTPQPPTITDNQGVNTNQPPTTYTVEVCGATVTLTGGNLQGCTYQWSGPGIVSTSGPSCVVNQTGWYIFTITNSLGCHSLNQVYVKFDQIDHVVPKTNMPDTIKMCGGCVNYFIYDSLSNPGGLNPYPSFTSLTQVITNNGIVTGCPPCSMNNLAVSICPSSSGWINLNIMYVFSSLCGKDTAYFHKSVYILRYNPPQVSVTIHGNTQVCPGDSTLLTATFTITPSVNVSYTLTANDSAWVHPGGTFYFPVFVMDTVTGCSTSGTGGSFVTVKPNPHIYTIPGNGVVCPGDSVKLVCQWPGAVSWQWYGPGGLLPANAAYVYASAPGYYYCVATDNNGCTLTSNSVEIEQYATPYIAGLPSTIGCSGQSVTIQVISNDSTHIQWLAPLSGTVTTQQISASGTYSCQVLACGITTMCTVPVVISNPVVQITATGNLTICPGDSVLLAADTGMASYLWLPNGEATASICAYAAGNYVVIATDPYGCQASDSVTVNYSPQAPPQPGALGDSICAGAQASLQATGMGAYTVQWYTQQYGGSSVNTGINYTTPPLYQNTTYYVAVMDTAGCHSLRTTADVFIIPTSLPPTAWGDSLLCAGDTLHLYSSAASGALYTWSGPAGFSSSLQNPVFVPVTASSAGIYSLFVSGGGCTSPIVSHSLAVIDLVQPVITSTDTLCQGQALTIQGQSQDTAIAYNWTGPHNFTSSSSSISFSPVDTSDTGTYVLQTTYGNCKSPSQSVFILVKPTPAPNAWLTGTPCIGDSVQLHSQTLPGASSSWTGPDLFASSLPSFVIYDMDSSKAGYYYFTSALNGCTGTDSVKVRVNPLPYFNLGNDTTVCNTDPWVINPGINGIYTWNGSAGSPTFTVTASGTITAVITNQYGCKYSDVINITVAECNLNAPNIFTPNGDGINDVFYFNIDHYTELKFIIYDRWGVKVFENSGNVNGWDGYNMYTGKPVTDGTYYYIVSSRNMQGTYGTDHGFLQIAR